VFGISAATVGILAIAVLLAAAASAQPGTTERASVSSSGEQGNDLSGSPSISADGRFVAFSSYASNLVPGDTNGDLDVFVRDRELGTTERVSLSPIGDQGDGDSYYPSISADGRFVAFQSSASSLVPGDTNGVVDVFVRDRQLGTTERVSVSSSGGQGNNESGYPSISADGRFVAFQSYASNLVPGDTNGRADVFVRDRQLETTERVSLSSSGEQGNSESWYLSISADGRFVAFQSSASNLVPGDTNVDHDVFVRDRQLGTTGRVSVSSSGEQGNYAASRYPSISADGRFVAFSSYAPNLVPGDTNGTHDVFVRDRELGTTERVSLSSSGEQGNSQSWDPSISADGRFVAFFSWASNLVPGDTNGYLDAFVRDRELGTTERVSLSSSGEQGNDISGWFYALSVSANGRFVAFRSDASNLVAGDTNGYRDVFVRDREAEWYDVSGTVTFQDLDASAVPPSSVAVSVRWHGSLFGSYEAELGPDGSYSLLLPAGELTLSAKHTHWLRHAVDADNSGGPVDGVDFSLVNGDCNDDNSVDLRDLAQVLFRLGKDDPMADLDEDGLVGLGDLAIVLRNFGFVGDG
jgi:Tol biopolymer transport system component